jgi:DNA-binding CsgD family transcriptional regulator
MTTTSVRSASDDLLDQLSPREVEVLALMAEGRSNRAIADRLAVELKTVETHVGRVFTKLGLGEDRYENRRVLAVLAYFGSASGRVPHTALKRGLRHTTCGRQGSRPSSRERYSHVGV